MAFDKETAAEIGRQGGIASGQSRRRSPSDKARELIESKTDKYFKVIIDIALAEGDFKDIDLPPKLRLDAATTLASYAMGKPGTQKAPEPETNPGANTGGLTFEDS